MSNSSTIISKPQLVIAGPCSAESREQLLEAARTIAAIGGVDILRAGVWKPRTKPDSFEGAGDIALEWLKEAKELTGLPIATEVATATHVRKAIEAGVDVLWIGARTTSNPFSVQEIAEELRGSEIPILVKNPTNADVELWAGAVERLQRCGVKNIGLIHRGFSGYNTSGYRNTPLWQLALEMKRRMPSLPMVCDPSHICGNRTGILSVAQQAADLDYSGIMVECHPTPNEALSDAEQQLTPSELRAMLSKLTWRKADSSSIVCKEELERLRGVIDRLDEEIFSLIAERMDVAEKIGHLKLQNNLTILQSERWQGVVERVLARTEVLGLGRECVRTILEAIHLESIERQNKIMH
jgi:chorismate mutase